MKIGVLGAGPTGLFAAYALLNLGVDLKDIVIIANRGKSELYGCQYLHRAVPGLNVESVDVSYELTGTIDGYRDKVYRESTEDMIAVSPQRLVGRHKAWDIRAAYDFLWNTFAGRICIEQVTYLTFPHFLLDMNFDHMISSIPKRTLCYQKPEHVFQVAKIWAAGDAPELGIKCPVPPRGENRIICNGDSDTGWYRLANVFGHTTVEYPGLKKPPIPVVQVEKPTYTNCDCYDDKVLFVGRYGMWDKKELVHDAFYHTLATMNSRLGVNRADIPALFGL